MLKCAVQWEIVGIKAENGNIFRLGVSTADATLGKIGQTAVTQYNFGQLCKLHKIRSVSFGKMSLVEGKAAATLM